MSRLLLLLALALPCTVQALEVVASIRPLALIADAVTGDAAQVRQLVPNGASSHEYALKPSDRALLARAGLVLWVGPVHEHFLPGALRGRPVLTAQDLPGVQKLPSRRLSDGSAVPGSIDPHLWLSPDNVAVIAHALAERLASADAAHAERYRRNAGATSSRACASSTWAPRPTRSSCARSRARCATSPRATASTRSRCNVCPSPPPRTQDPCLAPSGPSPSTPPSRSAGR